MTKVAEVIRKASPFWKGAESHSMYVVPTSIFRFRAIDATPLSQKVFGEKKSELKADAKNPEAKEPATRK